MRRWLTVGFALLAVAGLAGGGLYLYAERRTSAFSAALPQLPPPVPLPPVAARSSLIIVPVEVPLTAIRDALQARVPRGGEERQTGGGSGLLRDLTVQYAWTRGDIAVAAAGDALTFSAPIGGEMTAEARSPLGRVAGSGDVTGRAGIRARPQLLETWRIAPGFHGFEVETDDASIRIGPIDVAARTWGTRLARAAVERSLPRLNEIVAAHPFVEEAARKAWGQMCRSTKVEPRGDPPLPPVWVEVRPTGAVAGQPRVTANALVLTLGLEAAIRVTSEPTMPACDFPASLRLIDPPERGPVAVSAPIDLTFETVNRGLQALAGRSFTDAARNITVEVRSMTLRPGGDRLLATADVRLRQGTTGFSTQATIHALAEPVLDTATKQLRFRNVRLDVSSGDLIGRILGATAASVIEASFESALSVDLARELARVERTAEAAVTAFNARTDAVNVDLVLDAVTIDALAFDAERLRFTASATGTARATIETIPLR